MNIAVTVCFVPDTASVIEISNGELDRSRINDVINPYDEYALEEAVRCKERAGNGMVTVFSVASESSKELLRKTLAKGADRAVLVNNAAPADPGETALILSRAIMSVYRGTLPHLIFCGKQSTDFQSSQVPPMLAELLGINSASGASVVKLSGDNLETEREIEGGIEYTDLKLPALLSIEKGLNTPRNTTMKAVMEARKKPIDLVTVEVDAKPFVRLERLDAHDQKRKCLFLSGEQELVRLLIQERKLM
ncbi:MAG: electron transfer flavoprotein subunit beta/FixA family protein [Chlorobiaceae bacterium]|nr:electron transfer flavoprotein subunit beta/FixA family protein [Chlorobiaceae bacterium]